MTIPCPNCSANVIGNIVGRMKIEGDKYEESYMISLLECPGCGSALLGQTYFTETHGDIEFDATARVWPNAPADLHDSIPREVRKPLIAAAQCYENTVFSASAVMARRVIDAVCTDKAGTTDPEPGLLKLKQDGLIDEKFWRWATALLLSKNLGNDARTLDVDRQDASDVLEFAKALCNQVYVLGPKVDEYLTRQRVG